MKELSNQTPLSREAGQIRMTCPVCGIKFKRATSHVVRVAVSTCSRACAAQARIIRVCQPCVICGKEMELQPSDIGKITTCSKACSFVRRTKGKGYPISKGTTAVYKKHVLQMRQIGVCSNCGTVHGPWSLRNSAISLATGYPEIVNAGELWCRSCHLADVAALGSEVRDAPYRQELQSIGGAT